MSAPMAGTADFSAVDNRTVNISVVELGRTRDQLVQGLTSISTAINEFVRSYVQHTDRWLGTETNLRAGVDIAAMSNLFAPGVTAAEGALTAAATESTPGKRGPYKKNKERKKREKDPNAPKRPLTAYFLYSQHARDIVKGDFAKQSKTPAAQEVSDEILRRWTSMDLEARKPWKELYERNATKYRQDVADYKAKTGAAVEDQGDDDVTETAAAPAPPTVESLAPAVRAALDSAPATAEKKTKGKGKKKETAAAPAQASPSPSAQLTKVSAVPVPSADVPTKSSKRKSEAEKTDEPPKKRKRKSKAEKEAEEAAAAAAKPAETPAEGKKKRKSTKKDKSSD